MQSFTFADRRAAITAATAAADAATAATTHITPEQLNSVLSVTVLDF